jgi:hypothetical protein
MILIISSQTDPTTDYVIDYLLASKAEFFRIDGELIIEDINIKIDKNDKNKDIIELILSNKTTVNLLNFTSIWYRKGFINYQLKGNLPPQILSALNLERTTVLEFIFGYLEGMPTIGSFLYESSNTKLRFLRIARELGFIIPKTYITTNKNFFDFELGENFICKAICENYSVTFDDKFFSVGTIPCSTAKIKNLESNFNLMLLQENISKLYELRVFFINQDFFSMCIFSQQNIDTSVDSRNYSNQKIRRVPYQINNDLKQKLIKLNKSLGINTGSYDLIVTTDLEYIILELNHCGQFGYLSYYCNYNIENKISEALITLNNE